MPRIRGRLRRHRPAEGDRQGDDSYVEIDTGELAGILAAPGWLRDVGVTSWLLVGIALFLAGTIAVVTFPGAYIPSSAAGGVGGDDRRRKPVRRGRVDPGRADDLGGGPDLSRSGPCPGRGR